MIAPDIAVDEADLATAGSIRARPQLALLAIPFVWQIGGVPLINDVGVRPLGLPFPLVWQLVGVVIASASIAFVRVIDRRREQVASDRIDAE